MSGRSGFLGETPEDAFFLMHKSAARYLRVSLSDGGAHAFGMNDVTGAQRGLALAWSKHGLIGARTVNLKLTVPLRAWYVWQREGAHYLKTPFPHFQFRRPFCFADAGATAHAFSTEISCVLETSPARSLTGDVRLWIPLRAEDRDSVAGNFEQQREDGWSCGDFGDLAKALLCARDMSYLLLVPCLSDLQPASLAFRDPALALLTMDSLQRSLVVAPDGPSPTKRRRRSLPPLPLCRTLHGRCLRMNQQNKGLCWRWQWARQLLRS